MRQANTQISLGICPVWLKSSLCAQWIATDPSFLHADSEDWSDWADDMLIWVFARRTATFCHEADQMHYELHGQTAILKTCQQNLCIPWCTFTSTIHVFYGISSEMSNLCGFHVSHYIWSLSARRPIRLQRHLQHYYSQKSNTDVTINKRASILKLFGSLSALGTLFLEKREWLAVKLRVTPRY